MDSERGLRRRNKEWKESRKVKKDERERTKKASRTRELALRAKERMLEG